ncbi:hypothetical protein HK102_004055 [Quaeritorhiza haematococci]|nr:hypothetical protein HK102_004055 [Quaeritorhiza haematococci]
MQTELKIKNMPSFVAYGSVLILALANVAGAMNTPQERMYHQMVAYGNVPKPSPSPATSSLFPTTTKPDPTSKPFSTLAPGTTTINVVPSTPAGVRSSSTPPSDVSSTIRPLPNPTCPPAPSPVVVTQTQTKTITSMLTATVTTTTTITPAPVTKIRKCKPRGRTTNGIPTSTAVKPATQPVTAPLVATTTKANPKPTLEYTYKALMSSSKGGLRF